MGRSGAGEYGLFQLAAMARQRWIRDGGRERLQELCSQERAEEVADGKRRDRLERLRGVRKQADGMRSWLRWQPAEGAEGPAGPSTLSGRARQDVGRRIEVEIEPRNRTTMRGRLRKRSFEEGRGTDSQGRWAVAGLLGVRKADKKGKWLVMVEWTGDWPPDWRPITSLHPMELRKEARDMVREAQLGPRGTIKKRAESKTTRRKPHRQYAHAIPRVTRAQGKSAGKNPAGRSAKMAKLIQMVRATKRRVEDRPWRRKGKKRRVVEGD